MKLMTEVDAKLEKRILVSPGQKGVPRNISAITHPKAQMSTGVIESSKQK